MGDKTLSAPVLAERPEGSEPLSQPRLLAAGGDRPRLDGLAEDLNAAGFPSRTAVISEVEEVEAGCDIAVVDLRSWTGEAVAWCQRGIRDGWLLNVPIVFVAGVEQLRELHLREGLYEDFIESPYSLRGLGARLRLVRWRTQRHLRDALAAGELVVDPAAYRATLRGVPLELTYMEFELLKFLMSNPGRVFTREALLSRVWGYEYFGGLRTVDVHVRRLRSKLGEEYGQLIETVRGVGYRFER